MRLYKYSHACLRIESDGVLVIDPGVFTERAALDGVDAVLITHEHADHVNVDALAEELGRRPSVAVYTSADVATKLLSGLGGVVTTVADREEFTAAGLPVRAYACPHARIHPELPQVPNLAFLVDGRVYHPGDSFLVPEGASVETLFVPVSAPWLKASESVDFIRAVAPRRAYALHDQLHSAEGAAVTDSLLTRLAGCPYQRLHPGEAAP